MLRAGKVMPASAEEWLAAPKRIRQQSIRYGSGCIQDFNLDIFEHLKVVDYGDAEIPPEALVRPTLQGTDGTLARSGLASEYASLACLSETQLHGDGRCAERISDERL
jgi:hypothetical protein